MKNKGFTLIELLVVIAIIGILATFVISNLLDARSSARIASLSQGLQQFRTALEEYNLANGDYPGVPGTSYNFSIPSQRAILSQELEPYFDVDNFYKNEVIPTKAYNFYYHLSLNNEAPICGGPYPEAPVADAITGTRGGYKLEFLIASPGPDDVGGTRVIKPYTYYSAYSFNGNSYYWHCLLSP